MTTTVYSLWNGFFTTDRKCELGKSIAGRWYVRAWWAISGTGLDPPFNIEPVTQYFVGRVLAEKKDIIDYSNASTTAWKVPVRRWKGYIDTFRKKGKTPVLRFPQHRPQGDDSRARIVAPCLQSDNLPGQNTLPYGTARVSPWWVSFRLWSFPGPRALSSA